MAFKRILIAVDESALSTRAADIGMDMAMTLGAEVAFVYAIDPSLMLVPDGGPPPSEVAAELKRDGMRLMTDLRARLPSGVTALQFMPEGQPGPEIVKAAQEWDAGVIVIGTHSRRGISRALLGSVAEFVTRHAHCPVLVVPMEK